MPAKGVTFRYPLLPWDGVALSYPTDATICRTGAVFAICDNGAAVHQVASGAADRLAGVRNSDVQTLAIISIGRPQNQAMPRSHLLKTLTNLNIPLSKFWTTSRGRYRVTKRCSAGAGDANIY